MYQDLVGQRKKDIKKAGEGVDGAGLKAKYETCKSTCVCKAACGKQQEEMRCLLVKQAKDSIEREAVLQQAGAAFRVQLDREEKLKRRVKELEDAAKAAELALTLANNRTRQSEAYMEGLLAEKRGLKARIESLEEMVTAQMSAQSTLTAEVQGLRDLIKEHDRA